MGCKYPGKPPTASALTWELIEVGPKEHYVRSNLNGVYFNMCDLKPDQMRKVDRESDSPKYDCNLERFDKTIYFKTYENWYGICKRVELDRIKNWDPLMKIYKRIGIVVGFFCIIAIAYTLRMRKELKELSKWKKHVLDNDWSEVHGEEHISLSS